MDNILYIDLETTGIETHKARIVEIAFIFNGKSKSILINPTISIPDEASYIHGIRDIDVKDKPTFKDISNQLLELINRADCICGYNIRKYDLPVLYTEFLRCGITLPDKPILDVYEQIQQLMKSKKLKDVFYILTGRELLNAHSGLHDIEATKEILEIIQEKFLKM